MVATTKPLEMPSVSTSVRACKTLGTPIERRSFRAHQSFWANFTVTLFAFWFLIYNVHGLYFSFYIIFQKSER